MYPQFGDAERRTCGTVHQVRHIYTHAQQQTELYADSETDNECYSARQ